jgi:hypothetical protein
VLEPPGREIGRDRGAAADAVAISIARHLSAVLGALCATAAFAGLLPGETIWLGLLTSDPLMDALRASAAALLTWALVTGRLRLLARALQLVAAASVAVGVWALADPRLMGLLAYGIRPGEIVLLVASATVAVVAVRLLGDRRTLLGE